MSEDQLPQRDYMDNSQIQWRHEKPDFSKVDKKFVAEKTKNHKAGSLEKIVENLVKTWEMESSHKIREEVTNIINHSFDAGKPVRDFPPDQTPTRLFSIRDRG